MDKDQLRVEILDKISRAEILIEEAKKTCCTDQRDCMFDDLRRYLAEIKENMSTGAPHYMDAETQNKLARVGSVLGVLAIGCCKPEKRLPKYNKCTRLLNSAMRMSFELYESDEK